MKNNHTVQVLKMNYNGGVWRVINTFDKVNPYRIYYSWWEPGRCGLDEHRKLIEKYGDFRSCICHLKEIVFDERKW